MRIFFALLLLALVLLAGCDLDLLLALGEARLPAPRHFVAEVVFWCGQRYVIFAERPDYVTGGSKDGWDGP